MLVKAVTNWSGAFSHVAFIMLLSLARLTCNFVDDVFYDAVALKTVFASMTHFVSSRAGWADER